MRVGGCILDLRFVEESWQDCTQRKLTEDPGIVLDGAFLCTLEYVNCFSAARNAFFFFSIVLVSL